MSLAILAEMLGVSPEFVLSEDDVDRIASRVVERLRDENPAAQTRWLTATEVANLLRVTRDTVYERAEELGVMRIGSGPRPRLRFDRRLIVEAASCPESKGASPAKAPAAPGDRSKDRTRPTGTRTELLPIRGPK